MTDKDKASSGYGTKRKTHYKDTLVFFIFLESGIINEKEERFQNSGE